MAASVIRNLSGFRANCSAPPCFLPADEEEIEEEYDDELRDEVEDRFEEEEEDSAGVECQVLDPSGCDLYAEMTDRLLRFAELISSDVQRYFGRSHDSDTCDAYTGMSCLEVTGRHRYSNMVRVASSEQDHQPENLGPLAELFQNTQVKKQGLPMIQRRLPSSFWSEPRPNHLCGSADIPDAETVNINTHIPVVNVSCSSTPDFSDLLAHWASERDTSSVFTCEFQLP